MSEERAQDTSRLTEDDRRRIDELALQMAEWFSGDPKRIQHLMKVYAFSMLIGRREGFPDDELRTLAAAALVHDIGIKPAEEKFGSCNGKLQEQEGPEPARKMLNDTGFDPFTVARACTLVATHHTYTGVSGLDHQGLVEADMLVNLYEDDATPEAARSAVDKVFKTSTGTALAQTMFGI